MAMASPNAWPITLQKGDKPTVAKLQRRLQKAEGVEPPITQVIRRGLAALARELDKQERTRA